MPRKKITVALSDQFLQMIDLALDTGGKIDYTEQGMQGDNYVSLAVHLESMGQIKRFDKSLMAMPDMKWIEPEWVAELAD